MNLLVTFLLSLAGLTKAAYDPSSSSNVVVYWGQNSVNQATGLLAQKPLGEHCDNANVDIFVISFVISLLNNTESGFNLANYMTPTNCELDSLGHIISCDKLGEDIQKCQQKGKKILLSVGGAQGITETWFDTEATAKSAATSLWKRYGPSSSDSSVLRPFGQASVDGIDLDIERDNKYMDVFAQQLRTEMGTSGKYLTAAMECDSKVSGYHTNDLLQKASFDMIFVMAYNGGCNAATSVNKDVKIFMGIPGGSSATTSPDTGYVKPGDLATVVAEYTKTPGFGGVMIWDASQAWGNADQKNYQDAVKSALMVGGSATVGASATPSATG